MASLPETPPVVQADGAKRELQSETANLRPPERFGVPDRRDLGEFLHRFGLSNLSRFDSQPNRFGVLPRN